MPEQDWVERAADRGFEPVRAAVAAGWLPGAAIGVVTADGARAVRWDGCAALVPERAALARDTWFDLASLTKVILTVPAILRLVEAGEADLHDALSRHLPDLHQVGAQLRPDQQPPLRAVTLLDLLTHRSGLPAWAPLYTWGTDPATLKALLLQHDWPLGAPGYSDLGFMLLGLMVERRHGRPLAELPLPAGITAAPDPARTAATEACPWRGRVLRGETHDENAWALGGVAGHAGLFGTIDGVLDFACDLMAGRLLSPAATAALCRPRTATRALGWQIPHDDSGGGEPSWTGGSLCSSSALGHTGFTGTGLWIDPERGFAWALLGNRVHPARPTGESMRPLRRAFGNRITACCPR